MGAAARECWWAKNAGETSTNTSYGVRPIKITLLLRISGKHFNRVSVTNARSSMSTIGTGGVEGKSRVYEDGKELLATRIPLFNEWKFMCRLRSTSPVEYRAWAEARVAWPHKSTSAAGVNLWVNITELRGIQYQCFHRNYKPTNTVFIACWREGGNESRFRQVIFHSQLLHPMLIETNTNIWNYSRQDDHSSGISSERTVCEGIDLKLL